jgi:acetyl esterase
MPLDAQTHAALTRLRAINFALTRDLTPAQVRARERALRRLVATGEPEAIGQVEDRSIPGPVGEIPLRIYSPRGDGPFPILLYFHGGGGVMGDLDSEDALCRRLTNLAECMVVSVGYHLAPEHKFPAGPHECYAACQWVAFHAASFRGLPSQLAVGGMSAGGNLAAVITHMARDNGGPNLVFQLLLAPLTDFRLPNTPSMEAYATDHLLTREDIHWFAKHCLSSEEDKTNPLASPCLSSTFADLPPALIVTAEYDPLRDDGEHYGEQLKQAGIPVTISRRPGAIHQFLVPDQLNSVLAESAAALRAAFRGGKE